MRKLVQVGKLLAVVGFLGVVVMGASSATAARPPRPPFEPCICMDVWMPVLCPNGVIYSNSCYASCAGQSGCVPMWDFETE